MRRSKPIHADQSLVDGSKLEGRPLISACNHRISGEIYVSMWWDRVTCRTCLRWARAAVAVTSSLDVCDDRIVVDTDA